MDTVLRATLLRVLKHVATGGFCRDSTVAQCPSCGAYAKDEESRVSHVFGCKLEYVTREIESEMP